MALGVWQRVTDSFLNVLTWQKLSPQGTSLSGDCNFFNLCVFEGKFNLSASDSFTLKSSKKRFVLCYLLVSKLESNLETVSSPGKGPKPDTRFRPASAWIANSGRLFLWVTLRGSGSLHFNPQLPCPHHPMHTHNQTLTLTHSTKELCLVRDQWNRMPE